MISRFPFVPAAALAVAAALLLPTTAGAASASPACSPATAALQQRLEQLRFPTGGADGCDGPATRDAVAAFQKANDLAADGVAGPATRAALEHPAPARVAAPRLGRHVEVDLTRALLTVVGADRRVKAMYSVSTGTVGHETPAGTFRIGRKELRSWSVPYRTWMPYASYFTGGVAFHAGAVAAPRSSHGCVHVPPEFAAGIYTMLTPGTPVFVHA